MHHFYLPPLLMGIVIQSDVNPLISFRVAFKKALIELRAGILQPVHNKVAEPVERTSDLQVCGIAKHMHRCVASAYYPVQFRTAIAA